MRSSTIDVFFVLATLQVRVVHFQGNHDTPGALPAVNLHLKLHLSGWLILPASEDIFVNHPKTRKESGGLSHGLTE